ncbi:S41 family peptidase [Tepidiphilus olei]|uniref:S41 family peptidase n=1 Tax=Tepidiphilus olei TaxID=2502184 RepID=UPI00115C5E6E|nr:S41 family peptidase [Tepidiphilus olei]
MRRWISRISLLVVGIVGGALLTFNFSALAERNATSALPLEDLRAFAEVYDAVKKAYVEPVEDQKLISEAIRGMVSGLDPHSAYLDPEEYQELQVGTQGEFGGLGIEVGMEDGFVKVVSPIEDTPAFRAGIKTGDLIVKIDETPVKGMSLRDAVKRMRGKPGTKVTLTIVREQVDKPIVLTITREVITVRSVRSTRDDTIAYVRITQFQENTGPMLVEHLSKLRQEGAVDGLILDLRNDPGGLLNAAIGVSGAFLPEDAVVVRTEGRLPDSRREYRVRPSDYLRGPRERDYLASLPTEYRTLPMVVLINAGSASASEIVAGALQDHGRAKIFGTRSFGKGSVQTILPLNNGAALKLTTALYYTPNGRSIQAKGIEPDFVVEETENGSVRALREADLQQHLELDRDGVRRAPAGRSEGVGTGADEGSTSPEESSLPPRFEFGSSEDRQYQAALKWLREGVVPAPVSAEPSGAVSKQGEKAPLK